VRESNFVLCGCLRRGFLFFNFGSLQPVHEHGKLSGLQYSALCGVSGILACSSGISNNVVFRRFLGTIELHELQQVMRKLGQNPTEAELIEMISSVDDNGDNEIDFEEFLLLMKSRIGERDPEKELRDAFAVFDTDGSGSIDRKELKRLMKKLGQALTEAELDAMMDEVDTNGDGEISFAEFKAMMVSPKEIDSSGGATFKHVSHWSSTQFSNLNFLWGNLLINVSFGSELHHKILFLLVELRSALG
jgi:Ca2+-binding EF-hand superfamily protein